MNRRSARVRVIAAAALAAAACGAAAPADIALPAPDSAGALPLERAIAQRRSLREFAPRRSLPLAALSQLLWAAQGTTSPDGRRSAPSAGALYPLELCVVVRRVEGLPPGTYRYRPVAHVLRRVGDAAPAGVDEADPVARAARDQRAVADAPALIAITAVEARTAAKYGDRAPRYVAFEAGAAAQNAALQAVALGLGSVVVGAFDDDALARALGLPPGERPLALLAIGHPG